MKKVKRQQTEAVKKAGPVAVLKYPQPLHSDGGFCSVLPSNLDAKSEPQCVKVITANPCADPSSEATVAVHSTHRVGDKLLSAREDLEKVSQVLQEVALVKDDQDLSVDTLVRSKRLPAPLEAATEAEIAAGEAAALRKLNFAPDEDVFYNLQSLKVTREDLLAKLTKERQSKWKPAKKRRELCLERDFGFVPYQGEDVEPDLRLWSDEDSLNHLESLSRQRLRERYSQEATERQDREETEQILEKMQRLHRHH